MAIVVLSEAPDVGLVKNKMIYKVQTNRYKSTSGTIGVYRLEVLSIPNTGDSFRLITNDQSLITEFTFVDSTIAAADSSGTLIRDDQSTKANVATVIMLKMQQHPLVSAYYTISRATVGLQEFVELTAKKIGLGWGLNGELQQYFSPLYPFVAWSSITESSSDVYRGNFYILTYIFIYDEAEESYFLATQSSNKPDKNQIAEIDVAPLLKAYVDAVNLPEVGQSNELRLSDIVKTYKLVFCEQFYNTTSLLQPMAVVSDKKAWFAGLTEEDFADFPNALVDWFGNGKKTLSWFPNDREVREDEEHFFAFINYDTTPEGAGS